MICNRPKPPSVMCCMTEGGNFSSVYSGFLLSMVSSVSAPTSSILTFLGSVRDTIMEITNTLATGLPAKMSLTIFGIPEKNSGTCVTPMPMAKLVAPIIRP